MNWYYRHTVLALCTFAFFATMAARLVVSPVVPIITADFEISNTVIGIALSGMWLAYAASQFPSGILANRYGERALILVALGGTGVMSAFLALSPTVPAFLVAIIVLGGVAGLHYSVATSLLAQTFDEIGRAIGIHTVGGAAAGLIAPVAAAWVGVRYGWRPAVALGSVIAVPVFLLFAWRVEPTPPRDPAQTLREQVQLRFLTDLLARRAIAFTVVIAVLAAFVWQGLASFLPAFLIDHRGQSTEIAGAIFSLYFVVQAVVKPWIGDVSDRFGRDLAIGGCMVAGILGLLVFIGVPGFVAGLAGVGLLGIGMSWMVALEPRVMDHLADAERSTGFGLVRTAFMIVGSLGSVAVGAFADVFSWAISFGILVVLLALILAALTANRVLGLGY